MPVALTASQACTLTADPLAEFLRPVLQSPHGVPAALWERALAGPVAEFLARPGKRFRGRLVSLAWKLADGQGDPPPALPLVVELLHAGSLVVDDIQDGSLQRRGKAALHRLVGLPTALNAGNWLYFWPLTLIADMGLSPEIEVKLHRMTAAAVCRCHEGQALDLAARAGDLHPTDLRAVVRSVSEWKTGSLMGLAAGLGAAAAGGTDGMVFDAMAFGVQLGVALQMQNDLSELTGAAGPLKHPEDLVHGRVTWPWAWAADRLPAFAFDALQMRGARLAAGTGDASALAADLLAALGPDPRRPVRDALEAAFADLSSSFGPHPVLAAVRDELDRLEQNYV